MNKCKLCKHYTTKSYKVFQDIERKTSIPYCKLKEEVAVQEKLMTDEELYNREPIFSKILIESLEPHCPDCGSRMKYHGQGLNFNSRPYYECLFNACGTLLDGEQMSRKKRKKRARKRLKRRNPLALIVSMKKGSGTHLDLKKEDDKNKCRQPVEGSE